MNNIKKIELTLEHKSKILEMCAALFPEYGEPEGSITFHHHDDGKPDKNDPPYYLPGFLFGFKGNGEDGDRYDNASLFIHWFEFCTTYLMRKISDMYDEQFIEPYRKTNDIPRVNWEGRIFFQYWSILNGGDYKEHPVDYLYKQFKELNAKNL